MVEKTGLALLLATLIACAETTPGSAPPASSDRVTEEPSTSPPAAPAAPAASPCGDGTIRETGLGELRIGLPVESVKSRCTVVRDTTELRAEGMKARVISIVFGRDTVEAEVVDDKVWRIEVAHPDLMTRDSLHVGTPLGRLLKLRGVHTARGEGGVYLLTPEHCGLSFRLSGPGLQALPAEADKAWLEPLASTVSVSRILIIGCRSAA
jgi:hypothetical protein